METIALFLSELTEDDRSWGHVEKKKKVSGHTGPHLGSVTVSSVDGKIIWDFYNNDNSGSIVGYLLSASEAAVLTATLWKQ